MKLLFDQNLSPRLVQLLTELYPDSAHLHLLELGDASDAVVWDFAEENKFIIVSKDSDYLDCSAAFGFPPHVISIRSGNCRTKHIEALLRDNHQTIEQMVNEGQIGFVALM
jgi:predicted nuclease of predicted toxin-antitoxin system